MIGLSVVVPALEQDCSVPATDGSWPIAPDAVQGAAVCAGDRPSDYSGDTVIDVPQCYAFPKLHRAGDTGRATGPNPV